MRFVMTHPMQQGVTAVRASAPGDSLAHAVEVIEQFCAEVIAQC